MRALCASEQPHLYSRPCLSQVLRSNPNAIIILAAPTNSAADLLAERILDAGRPPSELLRVQAYSRDKDLVPLKLLEDQCMSNWDDVAGAFVLPHKSIIMARGKRVVAVTCAMAGKVCELRGMTLSHFSSLQLPLCLMP